MVSTIYNDPVLGDDTDDNEDRAVKGASLHQWSNCDGNYNDVERCHGKKKSKKMKAPMETVARCEDPTISEERLGRAGSPKMQ